MKSYENLREFIFECCRDRAEDYSLKSPNSWNEAKKMVKKIFDEEIPKQGNFTNYTTKKRFEHWIFGLCFCSPIMLDLTPYTGKATTIANKIEQEQEAFEMMYKLIFED